MAKKVFKSKVDPWVRLVILAVILFELFVIGSIAVGTRDPLTTTLIVLACTGMIALLVSVLIGTSYTVDRGVLRVASGPICWKIPLDAIHSVQATRSLLSSPALSLDRLRIRYGRNRSILVSPADRSGFLRAIGQDPGDRSGASQ
jgi:Bacterial PH domain